MARKRNLYLESLESRIMLDGASPAFPAGGLPHAVAVADFDKDGNLDVAVANGGTNDMVTVLFGTGDGALERRASYAVGESAVQDMARGVAAADVNGDGWPDIAATDYATDRVSVLLNRQDGSFEAARNFNTGLGPKDVAIGDMDGDGSQDLVVACTDSGNVWVLFGHGDGNFPNHTVCSAAGTPQAVSIGRFNGDNLPDIVSANGNHHNVSVVLNQGGRAFSPSQEFAAGGYPISVATADFDGDGLTDLAVSNYVNASSPVPENTVSVLRGNGNGTFQAAVNYPVGEWPYGIAVGQFTSDAHPDIVVADYGDDTVAFLMNNGDGTFGAAVLEAVGSGPIGVAVGKFNADEWDDIVVANELSGTVSIVPRGVGTLTGGAGTAAPASRPWRNDAHVCVPAQVSFTAGVQEAVRITSATVSGSGTLDEAQDVASVRLFNDVDNDGVYDPGSDLPIGGAQTFGQDNGAVVFSGLDHVITAGSTENWIVVYDMAGSASNGETFAASVSAAGATGVFSGSAIAVSGVPIAGPVMTIDMTGPRVLSVSPSGHLDTSPPAFVVEFDEHLDSASAQDLTNYTLAGPAGNVALASAVYSPATDEVTLTPAAPLAIGAYSLTVNGTSSVKDTAGNVLDGDGDGVPGGDHVAANFFTRDGAHVVLDGQHPQQFTDHDGSSVTVLLRRGSGYFILANNLTTGDDIAGIFLTTSSSRTSLKITVRNGTTSVGGVAGASAGTMDMKNVSIRGNVNFTDSLGTLTADDVADGVIIESHVPASSTKITLDIVGANVAVDVAGALTSFKATAWDSGTLKAESVKRLTIGSGKSANPGNCGADVTTANDARTVSIKGSATGDFTIGGLLGTMVVGGSLGVSGGGAALHAAAITSLAVGGNLFSNIAVAGAIGTLGTNPHALKDHIANSGRGVGDLVGSVAASSIAKLAIGGDVKGAITVTGSVVQVQTDDSIIDPAASPLEWLAGGTLTYGTTAPRRLLTGL